MYKEGDQLSEFGEARAALTAFLNDIGDCPVPGVLTDYAKKAFNTAMFKAEVCHAGVPADILDLAKRANQNYYLGLTIPGQDSPKM